MGGQVSAIAHFTVSVFEKAVGDSHFFCEISAEGSQRKCSFGRKRWGADVSFSVTLH